MSEVPNKTSDELLTLRKMFELVGEGALSPSEIYQVGRSMGVSDEKIGEVHDQVINAPVNTEGYFEIARIIGRQKRIDRAKKTGN